MLSEINKHCVKAGILKKIDFVAALVGALEESARMLALLILKFQSSLVVVVCKHNGSLNSKKPFLFVQ